MVLPDFLAPQDDELVFSLVARYAQQTCWRGTSALLDTLFGERHIVASYDLPGRLSALSERSPPELSLNAGALLHAHTLFEYLTATASPRQRAAAGAACIEGGGASHVGLGLAASRVARIYRLRFCPECVAVDEKQAGASWWRRQHQLPGAFVCLTHGCSLRESAVDLRSMSRHTFLAAGPQACRADAQDMTRTDGAIMALARVEVRTLSGTVPWTLDATAVVERLRAVGLMRSWRRVDQELLRSRFAARFGHLRDLLPDVLSAEAMDIWLPQLARTQRRSLHPLYHSLMMAFLEGEEVVVTKFTAPFGTGPWECRNPLADHFGRPVVTDLRVVANHGGQIGKFVCSCGYVYARGRSAVGDIGHPVYSSYGPLLDPALRGLIAKGESLRSISRAVSLDPKTVISEMARLGIEGVWGMSGSRRRPWAAPALCGAKVSVSRSRARRGRLDWNAIDAAMAEQALAAASTILSVDPAQRVTLPAIERELGRPGYLQKRLMRLPETGSVIQKAVEDALQFRTRRIRSYLASHPEMRQPWRVARALGIKGDDLALVRAAMSQHIV